MFSLFRNLDAALNGYLRFYMPTNRAIDWLRTPRGLKSAITAGLVTTPISLFEMSVCAVIIERDGPVVRLELDEGRGRGRKRSDTPRGTTPGAALACRGKVNRDVVTQSIGLHR